ncbi:fibrous sheath CABYR-binding protein-like [Penaeus monodon]|uniref:fibrous sheath CABYR-binding protein-like n=1 Tax=Penaeus monodon TaxID=6687 RepID=UPI0018A75791|nr:fibrous sheath CABYR-binding protein-like [Penaeus monodon]
MSKISVGENDFRLQLANRGQRDELSLLNFESSSFLLINPLSMNCHQFLSSSAYLMPATSPFTERDPDSIMTVAQSEGVRGSRTPFSLLQQSLEPYHVIGINANFLARLSLVKLLGLWQRLKFSKISRLLAEVEIIRLDFRFKSKRIMSALESGVCSLTLVRKWSVPLATAVAAPIFTPVVLAESDKKDTEAASSRLVRPSDLPIYESPDEVLDFEYHGRERTALEENIGVVRKEVEGVIDATRATREKIVYVCETGKAHTMEILYCGVCCIEPVTCPVLKDVCVCPIATVDMLKELKPSPGTFSENAIQGLKKGVKYIPPNFCLFLWFSLYNAARSTVDYITDEENVLPRAGAITVGGLTGLVIGRKGGFLRKVLYTSAGALTAASLCYPRHAYQLSQKVFENAKDVGTIGYNFVAGVKPQNKIPSAPAEPSKEEPPAVIPDATPAPEAAPGTELESGEVRKVIPEDVNVEDFLSPLDTVAQQSSDVTMWGFRLTDKASKEPGVKESEAPPTSKSSVPEGFGTVSEAQEPQVAPSSEQVEVKEELDDVPASAEAKEPEVAPEVTLELEKTKDTEALHITEEPKDIVVAPAVTEITPVLTEPELEVTPALKELVLDVTPAVGEPDLESKPAETEPELEVKPAEIELVSEVKPTEPEVKPIEMEPEPEVKPAEIVPEPEVKPTETVLEPEVKPAETVLEPEVKPAETVLEPEVKPAETVPEPEVKPTETVLEPEVKPAETVLEPEVKPAETVPEPEVKPVETVPEPEVKPTETLPETEAPSDPEVKGKADAREAEAAPSDDSIRKVGLVNKIIQYFSKEKEPLKEIVVEGGEKVEEKIAEAVSEAAEFVEKGADKVIEDAEVVEEIGEKVESAVQVVEEVAGAAAKAAHDTPGIPESVAEKAEETKEIAEKVEEVIGTVEFIAEKVEEVAEEIKKEAEAVESKAVELIESKEKREELIEKAIDYVTGKTHEELEGVEIKKPEAALVEEPVAVADAKEPEVTSVEEGKQGAREPEVPAPEGMEVQEKLSAVTEEKEATVAPIEELKEAEVTTEKSAEKIGLVDKLIQIFSSEDEKQGDENLSLEPGVKEAVAEVGDKVEEEVTKGEKPRSGEGCSRCI